MNRLAAGGVTPNQVTVAACALSVLLGLDLAYGSRRWLLLPLWLPLRMALNAMDGMLAREHGLVTPLGTVLNELTDLVADAALTLPFAYVADPLGVAVAVFFAVLAEVAAIAGGGPRRNHGPFGKSDRAVVLGFCGAWLWLGWPVAEGLRLWLPAAWVVLCGVTIRNRGKAFAG